MRETSAKYQTLEKFVTPKNMLELAKLMISDMYNVHKTSGIFYMGAYLPEHWIVADGQPFYYAE